MRLLFFPKYTQIGPSSRYRIYQYIPYFIDNNVKVFSFFDDKYDVSKSFKTPGGLFYLLKCYLNRIKNLLQIKKEDIVFVQYEFLPFLPFFSPFFKIKRIRYIVDFDDAAFHEYDQHKNKIVRFLYRNKIPRVIKNAKTVITGSPYLTNFAKIYNNNVFEIPTSINITKYKPAQGVINNNKFIIGWIGSRTTSVNLLALIPVFEDLKNNNFDFEVRCIGFNDELENRFENLPFKAIPWEESSEIENIRQFSVGIMPLEDNLFNKGKCAFKLIQYMACGIPTISTPLEANIKVNRDNSNLFATTTQEWIDSLKTIIFDREKYFRVGLKNREIVEKYYTVQENEVRYNNIVNELIIKKE